MKKGNLMISNDGFSLEGKPLRILSGAIHYFRVPRDYWEDRLAKLCACGFNTVETYIPWNLHEPQEGVFEWEDEKDFAAFALLAQRLGLHVILRPSPYICAEWEMGGLPWWLLKKPGLRLRWMNRTYLAAVDRYFDELIPRLAPLQVTRGGPVLMMQIENEYGSYGNDHEYLRYLAEGMKRRGVDVPLFTSDGGERCMLSAGTLQEYFKTVNFGSCAEKNFQILREYQPEGPLMCMEFWNGWFSRWNEKPELPEVEVVAQRFRECLSAGGNVSVYMFHGGSTFGWMNGASHEMVYQPIVTSYDYGALLTEAGDYTEKYRLFRHALTGLDDLKNLPPEQPKTRYGRIPFTGGADLLACRDLLAAPLHDAAPLPMEALDQGYGFTLYHTHVNGPREEKNLWIERPHDRALIFVNGVFRAIQYRNDSRSPLALSVPKEGLELDVLVENMGRVNYGERIDDIKGVTRGVRLGGAWLFHWDMWPLTMENLSVIPFQKNIPAFCGRPLLLRAELTVRGAPGDSFLKLPGFVRGVAFVNGRCLGRYWNVGPQQSLYLPGPWLTDGVNEILILELEGCGQLELLLDDKP